MEDLTSLDLEKLNTLLNEEREYLNALLVEATEVEKEKREEMLKRINRSISRISDLTFEIERKERKLKRKK